MIVTSMSDTIVSEDVALPVYRRHVMDWDDHDTVIYTRVTAKECVSVTRSRHAVLQAWSYELEVIPGERGFGSSNPREFNLGLGAFALTEQEFNDMVHEMRGFVTRVLHPEYEE